MIPSELRHRLTRIELKSRKLVHNLFGGAYASVYKGTGLVFSAVRPYEYGDDVRRIDWKVTARSSIPHIKEHIEERDRTVMIVIDASASMFFGSTYQKKRDFVAEIASIIAFSAIINNDRVGLIIFSEQVERYIPPRKTQHQLSHIIHTILTCTPQQKTSNLTQALHLMGRTLPKGSIVPILSDFFIPPASFYQQLLVIAQQHQLLALQVTDTLEQNIPSSGLVAFEDSETGETTWADTTSLAWQFQFTQQSLQLQRKLQKTFISASIPYLHLSVQSDYLLPLARFFRSL